MTVNTATPDYVVDGVLTDGEAWVPLQTTILTSDTVGVTWTSSTGANDWSQYMDLVVIAYSQSTTTANGVIMQFNNDATSTYLFQDFYTNGSNGVADSGTTKGCYVLWSDKYATQNNTYAAGIARIYDINSGKYKSVMSKFSGVRGAAGGYGGILGTVSQKQEAITEIDLVDFSANAFGDESRYDLFGILPRMVTA